MIKDKFGQYIYNEYEIFDIILQGIDLSKKDLLTTGINDSSIESIKCNTSLSVSNYIEPNMSVNEFDLNNQDKWHIPDEYKKMDIAKYVLSLCSTQEELQRCGEELLMYQDKNLFNLLRYLKYLVDIMTDHNIIWGVGRGSSVSSYILYKLKIHRVDSMYYKLDVSEFLR